jgi:hypothetical protein
MRNRGPILKSVPVLGLDAKAPSPTDAEPERFPSLAWISVQVSIRRLDDPIGAARRLVLERVNDIERHLRSDARRHDCRDHCAEENPEQERADGVQVLSHGRAE